jgi:hypothetical protein
MVRNKAKFYYASYVGETEIIDEYGNRTGEYKISYSNPNEKFGNVSAAQGEMESRQFGESESYDKVIVLDDIYAPIDEHSILWVDTLPHLNEDGSTDTPHDYEVIRKAVSLNTVQLAIRKVNVTKPKLIRPTYTLVVYDSVPLQPSVEEVDECGGYYIGVTLSDGTVKALGSVDFAPTDKEDDIFGMPMYREEYTIPSNVVSIHVYSGDYWIPCLYEGGTAFGEGTNLNPEKSPDITFVPKDNIYCHFA